MRNQLGLSLLIICIVLLTATSSAAGAPSFKRHVFRIHAAGCNFEPKERVQTGFRLRDEPGIITALHGVADCSSIAAESGDLDRNLRLNDLIVGKVDVPADTAVLWSNKLAALPREGLAMAPAPDSEESLLDMEAVGHPFGAPAVLRTPVDVNPELLPLRDVIERHIVYFLEQRASPAPDAAVYSVQGDLEPGHSGAPIMDEQGNVLAVGNGGLRSGTVGQSWAIPLQSLTWEVVNAQVGPSVSKGAQRDMSRLSAADPEYAFSFAPDEGYQEPALPALKVETWSDPQLGADFTMVEAGEYQYGSTYVEANDALNLCYEYSGGLCLFEAFEDELVDKYSRGIDSLADYWIMQTEVSNAQYDACIVAGGCDRPGANVRTSGEPDQPVILGEVQYAIQFADWACGRLPTELEWEKAARGPDGLVYPWGDKWDFRLANSCGLECDKKPLTEIALKSDGYPTTAPVTAFPKGRSPYGLYNMAGNVREWVVRDLKRPFSQKDMYMLKGGSFYDFPDVLRTADRLRRPNDNRRPEVVTAGFRIVRDTAEGICR